MSSLLESEIQKEFLKNLLAWYKKHGRHDMPWRKTADPYSIFVSEYMLQQTTVATVGPYYDRFLKKFPTIQSLAQADLNDVLALWSGLGYYARARNLWAAIRSIEDEHHGKIPFDTETLQKLPGVGFYTSGAISSLAFNKPASVLDGNIIRVLMRIMAMDEDPKLKAVQIILRKISLDLGVLALKTKTSPQGKSRGPKDLVLALMDLGATVCLPRSPNCPACPVSEFCLAKKYGKQNEIPMKEEKMDRPTVRRLHALVQFKGKWLLGQRPKEGLFGGLWEFPGVDSTAGTEPIPYLEESFTKETGLEIQVKEAIPTFEHQLTHRVFIVRGFLCEPRNPRTVLDLNKKGSEYDHFRWVSSKGLSKLGVSAITKRIMNELALKKTND